MVVRRSTTNPKIQERSRTGSFFSSRVQSLKHVT